LPDALIADPTQDALGGTVLPSANQISPNVPDPVKGELSGTVLPSANQIPPKDPDPDSVPGGTSLPPAGTIAPKDPDLARTRCAAALGHPKTNTHPCWAATQPPRSRRWEAASPPPKDPDLGVNAVRFGNFLTDIEVPDPFGVGESKNDQPPVRSEGPPEHLAEPKVPSSSWFFAEPALVHAIEDEPRVSESRLQLHRDAVDQARLALSVAMTTAAADPVMADAIISTHNRLATGSLGVFMTNWKSAENTPTYTENKAPTGRVVMENKSADIIPADTKDRTPPSPVAKEPN
jgi:hypothetical protein